MTVPTGNSTSGGRRLTRATSARHASREAARSSRICRIGQKEALVDLGLQSNYGVKLWGTSAYASAWLAVLKRTPSHCPPLYARSNPLLWLLSRRCFAA